ncbi:hypothetical protein CAEBREN_10535 [Caenorhabditis brenneri]|uniref:Uncharacterized protein n=1 Tax=Caenorhabditis brenneri TaxID=135651 RepID=G0ME76_CAEBE|nr:hypothetical protein CAEBREN_10535 [Caenorhabditis brenneri]
MTEAVGANPDESSQMVQYIMANVKNSVPLRLLINGAKSSRKTHLVDSLKERLNNSRIPYILLTHSNIRAKLIDDETICKKTKINPHELFALSTANKKDFRNSKLLILDKVDTLNALDTAVRKIKKSPELFFGNIHLVFIADFYQLSRSKGEPSYQWGEWMSEKFIFRTLAPNQEKDSEFCLRLGRWAVGDVSLDDIKFLREKQICHVSGDLFFKTAKFFWESKWDKKKSLILTPKNSEVLKFSKHLLRLQNVQVFEKMDPILIKTLKKGEIKPSYAPYVGSNPMYIGIDALVTFTCKTASISGPYAEEGDVGRILDYFKKDGHIVALTIRIGYNGIYSTFQRQETLITETDEEKIFGYQFFLRPAHVSTIHDAQEQILEHAIIHTHHKDFGPAVFYSAVSRLESSEGLHFTHIGNPSLDDMKKMIHANPLILSKLRELNQELECDNCKFPKKKIHYFKHSKCTFSE